MRTPPILRGPLDAADLHPPEPVEVYHRRRLARILVIHVLAIVGAALWISDLVQPALGALHGFLLVASGIAVIMTLIVIATELLWRLRARSRIRRIGEWKTEE